MIAYIMSITLAQQWNHPFVPAGSWRIFYVVRILVLFIAFLETYFPIRQVSKIYASLINGLLDPH